MTRKNMKAKRLAADYRLHWLDAITRDRTLTTRAMQVALAFALEIDWGGPEDQMPEPKALAWRTGLSRDDVIAAARQLRDHGYVNLDHWPQYHIKSLGDVIPFPTKKNFGEHQ
jgi:hypothetical protein